MNFMEQRLTDILRTLDDDNFTYQFISQSFYWFSIAMLATGCLLVVVFFANLLVRGKWHAESLKMMIPCVMFGSFIFLLNDGIFNRNISSIVLILFLMSIIILAIVALFDYMYFMRNFTWYETRYYERYRKRLARYEQKKAARHAELLRKQQEGATVNE